jgi:hypothetical protein
MPHVRQVQHAQNRQQPQQQGRDARKAQAIEVRDGNPGQRFPSTKTRRSNQKTRDCKEDLHTLLAIPNQRSHQLFR